MVKGLKYILNESNENIKHTEEFLKAHLIYSV